MNQEKLKSILVYDKLSGNFFWRLNGRKAGYKHKKPNKTPYIVIQIEGRRFYAHRLAWLYVNGNWPKKQIDHRDGDGLNNAISNLRDVPNAVNSKNRMAWKLSKTGVMGVTRMGKRFRSRIYVDSKEINLGTFDSFEDAVKARRLAEISHGFGESHNKKKHSCA